MMLNEASKIDLKQFIKLLITHKYKIILFTFVIVISANIYSLQFKDTVSLKRVIVVNKPFIKETISIGKVNNMMKSFFTQHQQYKESKIKFFKLHEEYRLEIIINSTNKEEVKMQMEELSLKFDEDVFHPLLEVITLSLLDIENKGKGIKTEHLLLKEEKERLNKELQLLISQKNSSDIIIDNLSKRKVLLETTLEVFEETNKEILRKYNFLKSYFGQTLKMENLFTVTEDLYVYTHSKIKFFIFSLVFGLITAIALVTLFFNVKKEEVK